MIGVDKRSTIAGVLIWGELCGVTLFIYSYRFVNAEITSKWLGMTLCIGGASVVYGAFCQKIFFPAWFSFDIGTMGGMFFSTISFFIYLLVFLNRKKNAIADEFVMHSYTGIYFCLKKFLQKIKKKFVVLKNPVSLSR